MMQSSSLLVASLLWLSGVAGFAPPLVRTTLLGRAPFQAGSSSSSYQAEVAGRGASPALDVKDDLEAAISDGVDKGYWVRSRETGNNIKQLVAELEAADSRDVAFPRDFIDLDGRWRLLYSSNVLGVTRVSPLQLDEVYQVIDTSLNSVKNVVYGTLRPPLFVETWGRFPLEFIANTAQRVNDMVSIKVDFSLDHTFEISSMEFPAELKIAMKSLRVINSERSDMRSLTLPSIRPLAKAMSGKFQTTYLDEDFRVSRGSFGEIRVFRREEEGSGGYNRAADSDWVATDYSPDSDVY